MNPPPLHSPGNDAMEEALAAQSHTHFILRLYITGPTPQSTRAIVNTRKICEEYLAGRYELEVVDIRQEPLRAAIDQIVAAPTLIKELPVPVRRFIGDMSDTLRIVNAMNIFTDGSPEK